MTQSMSPQRNFEYYFLYSCLGEGGPGSKLYGKYLGYRCKYRNDTSWLYMTKGDLKK